MTFGGIFSINDVDFYLASAKRVLDSVITEKQNETCMSSKAYGIIRFPDFINLTDLFPLWASI